MSTWRWKARVLAVAALCVGGLVGCGSSGTGGTTPTGGNGAIRGQVDLRAANGTVLINGTNQSARVGADGSFTLPNVAPGEYTVTVICPDGSGGSALVRVLPDKTTPVDNVPLAEAGQITGIIRSAADNKKIPGARVVARLTPYIYANAGAAPPGVLEGIRNNGGVAGRQAESTDVQSPPRVAVTDALGQFRIEAAEPGSYTIEVSAEGFENGVTGSYVAPSQTGLADLALVPILPENATLKGTVLGDTNGVTAPLAQVRVDLWPARPTEPLPLDANGKPTEQIAASGLDLWMMPPYWWGKTVLTDEQGGYVLRNLRPGDYTLSFQRYGFAAEQRQITLGAGATVTADATLKSVLATITGQVLARTANGLTPLVGAWVNAYGKVYFPCLDATAANSTRRGRQSDPAVRPIMPPYEPPRGVALTDSEGRYRLEVEAGHVWVSAWADRFQSATVELEVAAPGRDGVDLVLAPWPIEQGPAPANGGAEVKDGVLVRPPVNAAR